MGAEGLFGNFCDQLPDKVQLTCKSILNDQTAELIKNGIVRATKVYKMECEWVNG